MTHPEQPTSLGVGSVVGDRFDRFHLDAIEAESPDATVYLATPLQSLDGLWVDPEDTVGDTVFVVVLRHQLAPELQQSIDRWKIGRQQMHRAMTLVSPAVAGFPEWNKIRADDPVKLDQEEIGDIQWGAFRVSTARRRLIKLKAQYRRPKNFTPGTRRLVLEAADHRCQRCGSQKDLEVDHIIPIGLGGTNGHHNGLVLCGICHVTKSSAERRAFGQTLGDAARRPKLPEEVFRDPIGF